MWDASAVIVVRRVQDAAGEPANVLGSDVQPVAQMHRLFPGTKRGQTPFSRIPTSKHPEFVVRGQLLWRLEKGVRPLFLSQGRGGRQPPSGLNRQAACGQFVTKGASGVNAKWRSAASGGFSGKGVRPLFRAMGQTCRWCVSKRLWQRCATGAADAPPVPQAHLLCPATKWGLTPFPRAVPRAGIRGSLTAALAVASGKRGQTPFSLRLDETGSDLGFSSPCGATKAPGAGVCVCAVASRRRARRAGSTQRPCALARRCIRRTLQLSGSASARMSWWRKQSDV